MSIFHWHPPYGLHLPISVLTGVLTFLMTMNLLNTAIVATNQILPRNTASSKGDAPDETSRREPETEVLEDNMYPVTPEQKDYPGTRCNRFIPV